MQSHGKDTQPPMNRRKPTCRAICGSKQELKGRSRKTPCIPCTILYNFLQAWFCKSNPQTSLKQKQKKLLYKSKKDCTNPKMAFHNNPPSRSNTCPAGFVLKLLNCLDAPFKQRRLKTNPCSRIVKFCQWCSMDLHGSLNRAQCLATSVPRKQKRKQPKTKTVGIEYSRAKPLTQHTNLTSEVILRLSAQCHRFLHNALHACTMAAQ